MAGVAFFDSATVYPVLLARLGASDALVGMSRLIQTLGVTLPALFAAHRIHGRVYHKGFLVGGSALARAGLFTLPFALLLFGKERPDLALAWVFGVTAVFWIFDGACLVSWLDIVGKIVPQRRRGRFFGAMQALAGLFAIGAGLIVHQILRSSSLAYPGNFALLAGLWFVAAMVSQIGIMMIVEPAGDRTNIEPRVGFLDYIRMLGPFLRRYPRVLRLILARLLLEAGSMATPFYVLYAQRDLGASLQAVGFYTVALNAGRVASGPFWGWLTDRFGTSTTIRTIGFSIVAAPMAALLCRGETLWAMFAVFVILGSVGDGLWMAISNALLESVEPKDRPFAVGVASVCQTPGALYGPMGGALAEIGGYRVVFGCAATVISVGVLIARGLGPPIVPSSHDRVEREQR